MQDKKHILIVEDEIIVGMELTARLKKMGYGVVGVVASGRGAIRLAHEKRPDLVLMDIVIQGDLDGAQAAEIIGERSAIPVVFMSAYSDDETMGTKATSSEA